LRDGRYRDQAEDKGDRQGLVSQILLSTKKYRL
jgi:hypothetical protein